MAKNFKTNNYDRDVYNILNRDFVEGGEGLTRHEIQQKMRKQFKAHQWGLIMKNVRAMVRENGLIVPKATAEGGWKYAITNDPNPVFPGLLHSMRQQSGIRAGIHDARKFIALREDSIDNRMNGRVLKAADLILEQEALMEKMLAVVEESFMDVISERKEAIKQMEIGSGGA